MAHQFDLIIIGGGMVGSALAAALDKANLSIAVIETQLATAPSIVAEECSDVDMRVSALNHSSEHFLSTIGVWHNIPESRKCAYDKMRVWDGVGTGHIEFNALEMSESHLGHIVENRFTANALIEKIAQQKNVQIFSPATVESIEHLKNEDSLSAAPGTYFVQLDNGHTLYSPLIVAADGARSFVRSWAQFETREWDYHHHGIVCTVETEQKHESCAWQRFTEDGVLAFLPVKNHGNKNLCSIVWSCGEANAQALMALSDADFMCQLTKAFEKTLGAIKNCGPRASIPLRQRHAKQYAKNGIVLIGDAAHTIHPLAGQGVNLGLMDAYVLADEIKQGLKRGVMPQDTQLLQRYERRRMPENLTMMATMESFKRLFAVQSPGLRWLRNWGMNKMNRLSLIKNHIVQEAMGLKRNIR